MDFGEALNLVKRGSKITRSGWNGKGMWVGILRAADSHMTQAFLYLKTADGSRVPWTIAQSDALADDWEEVT